MYTIQYSVHLQFVSLNLYSPILIFIYVYVHVYIFRIHNKPFVYILVIIPCIQFWDIFLYLSDCLFNFQGLLNILADLKTLDTLVLFPFTGCFNQLDTCRLLRITIDQRFRWACQMIELNSRQDQFSIEIVIHGIICTGSWSTLELLLYKHKLLL